MRLLKFGLAVSAAALFGVAARADDQPPDAMAFIAGTMLDQAIDVCHIDATAAQRAAIKARVTQLRTQLPAAAVASVSADAVKPSDCPSNEALKQQFTQLIPAFLDKPIDQVTAAFDAFDAAQKAAQAKAASTPAPAAPAVAAAPAAPAPVPPAAAAPTAAAQPAETTVGGWLVTQRPKDGVCSVVRDYKDPDDDNKENAVAFLMRNDNPDAIVVSLVYEGWDWDKDEKVTADFKVDRTMLLKKSSWTGGGKTALVGTFTGADMFMTKVGSGQKLFLTFGRDSEANFLIPNAGLALGAMKLCLAQK